MMEKTLVNSALFAGALLVCGAAPAWDYCFEVACPDCSDFTPQQIRVDFNPVTGCVSGIAQGNQDEWGHAVGGKVVAESGKVYFARRAGSGKIYFYEIDLQSMTGQRLQVKYSLLDQVDYEPGGLIGHSLSAIPCTE